MHKGWSFIIAALALAGSFCVSAQADDNETPSLVIKTLDGKTFDLAALKGKVILVHFWATWCGPCRLEMPVLDQFYQQYHSQGIEVISISVEQARYRPYVAAYMQGFHLPTAMFDDATANSFGAPEFIPVTYIVDWQGEVRGVFRPDQEQLNEQNLQYSVLPLLPK